MHASTDARLGPVPLQLDAMKKPQSVFGFAAPLQRFSVASVARPGLPLLQGALLAACLSAHAGAAEQPSRLDALQVTASPVGTVASDAMRSVWVIDRTEIERAGAATLADVLARQPGLSIQRRGAPGVQADLGIRGSSFEQTLILIDGVPLQNPQAGHHNLDVPVPLSHIERIEIVKGPGAIQYGGSATGGVVNIITRQPQGTEGTVQASVGSHDTWQFDAHLAGARGTVTHALSIGALDSDGDAKAGPTDARVRQMLYTGSSTQGTSRFDWGGGALEKDFGAWGFYSAEYPDARERTESRLAWIGANSGIGAWRLAARMHFDQHDDWFLTRIAGRDYINEHETKVAGFQGSLRREDAGGSTMLGTDLRRERLESNALGKHRRDKTSFWLLRHQQLSDRTRAELGLNRAEFDGDSAHWLPSLAVSHHFNANWRGFASAARSARAPSYTELFLATAANRGNGTLKPETSDYAELGAEASFDSHGFQVALYERRTQQLIDWARQPGTVTWIASNVDGYRGRGFEATWRWRPRFEWLDSLALSHDRLNVAIDEAGREVKYATRVPRYTWQADARFSLGTRLQLDINLRRPSYAQQESATLADVQLGWQGRRLRTFVQVQNLGGERIVETGFAPIPGRWVSVGIAVDL